MLANSVGRFSCVSNIAIQQCWPTILEGLAAPQPLPSNITIQQCWKVSLCVQHCHPKGLEGLVVCPTLPSSNCCPILGTRLTTSQQSQIQRVCLFLFYITSNATIPVLKALEYVKCRIARDSGVVKCDLTKKKKKRICAIMKPDDVHLRPIVPTPSPPPKKKSN